MAWRIKVLVARIGETDPGIKGSYYYEYMPPSQLTASGDSKSTGMQRWGTCTHMHTTTDITLDTQF